MYLRETKPLYEGPSGPEYARLTDGHGFQLSTVRALEARGLCKVDVYDAPAMHEEGMSRPPAVRSWVAELTDKGRSCSQEGD